MILLSEELILKAYDIILKELRGSISEIDLDEDTGKLVIKLKSGVTVFLRYNNYGQYSYVVMFSFEKLDRVRFDNFDDKWEVPSKPHHTHPRHQEKAIESPFKGIPSDDIKFLCSIIQSGEIYRFGL